MGMPVSDLEKAIRERAVKEARDRLWQALSQATQPHLPNGAFYDVVEPARKSILAAFDEHCVKKVGDLAVGQFLATYGSLVREFPHLQAQLDEAQQHEGY